MKRKKNVNQLDVYKCSFCAFWHIGNRQQKRKKRESGNDRPGPFDLPADTLDQAVTKAERFLNIGVAPAQAVARRARCLLRGAAATGGTKWGMACAGASSWLS